MTGKLQVLTQRFSWYWTSNLHEIFRFFLGGVKNVGSPCWCVHITKRSTGALEKRCERNVPHGVPVPRMDDTTQRGTCVTAKRAAANRTKAQRASKAIGTAPVDWWLRKEDNQQVTDPIKFVFRQVLPCVAKKKGAKKLEYKWIRENTCIKNSTPMTCGKAPTAGFAASVVNHFINSGGSATHLESMLHPWTVSFPIEQGEHDVWFFETYVFFKNMESPPSWCSIRVVVFCAPVYPGLKSFGSLRMDTDQL